MPNGSELMKRVSSDRAYIFIYSLFKTMFKLQQGFLTKLSFIKLITQTIAVQLQSPNCYWCRHFNKVFHLLSNRLEVNAYKYM